MCMEDAISLFFCIVYSLRLNLVENLTSILNKRGQKYKKIRANSNNFQIQQIVMIFTYLKDSMRSGMLNIV